MKRTFCLLLCLVLFLSFTIGASAETSVNDLPYDSYVYRDGETALSVPAPFACNETYTAADFGLDSFQSMADLYFNGELLYICDSGKNRIIVLIFRSSAS